MKKEIKVKMMHGRRKNDNTVWVRVYFPTEQKTGVPFYWG